MAEKRKDSKGRILRNGEVQRSDGRYMFRYIDANGERQTIYSWKLVETDKVPDGRRCDEALRSIEKRVLGDVRDKIVSASAADKTVNMLFDEFMAMRTDLKESTRCGYLCLYNAHVRGSFGHRKIDAIRYSDVYKFYMNLHDVDELKISSIQSINSIIWGLFETAVRDDIIRRNPASGAMSDVRKKLDEDVEKRHALTIDEQSELLDYIYGSSRYQKYGTLFTTLLGTGMRIGEALGLRWKDVDFCKGFISVNHALAYKGTEGGGYQYRISKPKTKAGNREIPMFSDVKKALQAEKRRKNSNTEPFMVDGYSDFVFLNSAGKVYTPAFIFDTIQNIVTDYNRDELASATEEDREPHYLPKISAHILRHTFCTRLCENESNTKVVQEVMGHKNIRTTMDVYNEATREAKKHSFASIDGKIKLR